jgi:hypothetical protein
MSRASSVYCLLKGKTSSLAELTRANRSTSKRQFDKPPLPPRWPAATAQRELVATRKRETEQLLGFAFRLVEALFRLPANNTREVLSAWEIEVSRELGLSRTDIHRVCTVQSVIRVSFIRVINAVSALTDERVKALLAKINASNTIQDFCEKRAAATRFLDGL